MAALRLCLNRMAPAPKVVPVRFDLPPIEKAADAVAASAALLRALANGEVTPDEASRVMALLTTHKQMLEAIEEAAKWEAMQAAARRRLEAADSEDYDDDECEDEAPREEEPQAVGSKKEHEPWATDWG
jgi:anti-sigma factor RsiW